MNVPARTTGAPGEMEITFAVDPNAVKGKGRLQLVATSLDGTKQKVSSENAPNAVVDVEIGGEIDVDHRFKSGPVSTIAARATGKTVDHAFIAHFQLTSAGEQLSGARLVARLQKKDGDDKIVGDNLYVSAAGGGQYQVSHIASLASTPSGEYEFLFFREVDQRLANQKAEQERRLRQKERARAEARGEEVVPEEEDAVLLGLKDINVEPMFSFQVSHKATSVRLLPVNTEFVVLLILVLVFMRIRALMPKRKQRRSRK